MKSFISWLFKSRESYEETYYSNATDLADLEVRMRKVQRGEAPFQKVLY